MKALFETIAVPLAPPGTPGVFYRGLRAVAFGGLNSVKVPDSDRNRSWLGKTMTCLGLAGYPAMRIVALAQTGTRGLPGTVTGGKGERSEVPLARKLVPLLREGMLLLADRACDGADLLKEAAATGAHLLVLQALQPTKDAVVRAGALLIVKVDWVVQVHQLTAAQQAILDHRPQLAASPTEIVSALQLSNPDLQDAAVPSAAQPARCDETAEAMDN